MESDPPPLGPDTISSAEYARALELLRSFLEGDVTDIQTLGELNRRIAGVGGALAIVIRINGKEEAGEFTLKKWLKDPPAESLVARTNTEKKLVSICAHTMEVDSVRGNRATDSLFVIVPVGVIERYDSVHTSRYDEHDEIFATSYSRANGMPFFPTKQPTDPVVQQTYATILQSGIRKVLAETRPPISKQDLPPL